MLRLPRLSISNGGLPSSSPSIRPNLRAGSPLDGSILTTSAPQSARIPPAAGPATHTPSSTTLMPSSGPAIVAPFVLRPPTLVVRRSENAILRMEIEEFHDENGKPRRPGHRP